MYGTLLNRMTPLLFLLTTHCAAAGIPGRQIPDFTIEDQFKRAWTRSDFLGSITIFMVSDRTGYSYNDNWLNALVPRFQRSVRFVAVADVQIVPGFLKAFIRDRFRSSFTYPVLMDWEGDLIESLDVTPGYPNLILADGTGRVVYSTHGKGSTDQVNRLARNIEALMAAQ